MCSYTDKKEQRKMNYENQEEREKEIERATETNVERETNGQRNIQNLALDL